MLLIILLLRLPLTHTYLFSLSFTAWQNRFNTRCCKMGWVVLVTWFINYPLCHLIYQPYSCSSIFLYMYPTFPQFSSTIPILYPQFSSIITFTILNSPLPSSLSAPPSLMSSAPDHLSECGRLESESEEGSARLPDGQIFRLYVFGPSGFWTMAPLRCAAKFDPFLSLDCAPRPPPWHNPRKGRDQFLPSGNLEGVREADAQNGVGLCHRSFNCATFPLSNSHLLDCILGSVQFEIDFLTQTEEKMWAFLKFLSLKSYPLSQVKVMKSDLIHYCYRHVIDLLKVHLYSLETHLFQSYSSRKIYFLLN